MPERSTTVVHVHPYRLVAFAVGLVVGLRLLPTLQPFGLAVCLALIIGLLLDVPVSFLARRGLPRPAATAAVVVGVVGAAVMAGVLVVPTVVAEARRFAGGEGGLRAVFAERLNELGARLPFEVPAVSADAALVDSGGALGLVGSGAAVLAVLAVAALAGVWGVAYPAPLLGRLLAFVPPSRRGRVGEIGAAVLVRLRRWLLGQMVLSVALGLGTYVVFRLCGVPFAALWAVLAALCESVPSVGFLLSSIPPVALTLLTNPSRVVPLIVLLLIVQQLENHVLAPTVMRRALDIPQALLILVMFAFGLLLGPIGAIMAVPLTATVITIHDEMMRYDATHPDDDGAGAGPPDDAPALQAGPEPTTA